jgi:SM-20-related protein
MEDQLPAEGLQEKSLLNETHLNNMSSSSYCVLENCLSPKDLSAIKSYACLLDDRENFRLAGTGQGEGLSLTQTFRNDRIKWLERNEHAVLEHSFFSLIDRLKYELNRHFFLSLKDFECHLTIYSVGSYYKKHRDTFNQSNNRVISFVLYLNENWTTEDGGELLLYDERDSEMAVIYPTANKLVLFKSDLEHEVKTAHKPRMSITGWMLQQTIGLEFLAP